MLQEIEMIDWDRVRELRQEVGAEDFDDVIEVFLEEVDEVIARLKGAPEPAKYEEDLHFLKGSALNLGFADFGSLCQDGESAAAAGRQDAVELAPIIDSYLTSRAAFLERMAQGLAA